MLPSRLSSPRNWKTSSNESAGLDGGCSGLVEAFVGLDGVDELSEVLRGVFKGAFPGVSHPVLDLCEGLFDGVEVGRVGRQEPELCAGAADRLADRSFLVASEVVEDDDVARPQGLNVHSRSGYHGVHR